MIEALLKPFRNKFTKLFIGCACVATFGVVACGGSGGSDFVTRVLCALAVYDLNNFAVSGENGFSAYTQDGGLSFTDDSPGTSDTFTDSEIKGSSAWSVGLGGSLYEKVSLTAEYKNIDSGTSADLHDLEWAGDSFGISVGVKGTFTRTLDAGLTWNAGTFTDVDLHSISCPTEMTCFTAGSLGMVYRTDDQGSTWRQLPLGFDTSATLRGIYAPSVNHAWVVGDGGLVARTMDGGENFSLIDAGTDRDLYDVYIGNQEQNGLIVGDSFLGRISDGVTITPFGGFALELGVVLKKIQLALVGDLLFIAGGNGTLYKTADFGLNLVRIPVITSIPDSNGGDFGDTGDSGMGNDFGDDFNDDFGDDFNDTGDSGDSGGSTDEIAEFQISDQDFSFSHNVGQTNCPQQIGQFVITNTGTTALNISIQGPSGGQLSTNPSSGISLEAGETQTVTLFFTCSQASSFNEILTISGQSPGGQSASALVNVQGNVS
ncbi:MAG: hypothetical protein KDD64_09295 [Bdellovibrionales bacterium]|nr:hypothetical protein [Bdellovibrionales bacterium]